MTEPNNNFIRRHPFILSLLCLLLVVTGVSAFGDLNESLSVPQQTIETRLNEAVPVIEKVYVPQSSDQENLSNDNYYINVDGNKVHSPAYSDTRPNGASARCRDGTYSFSQNRRGTCSHHGGVAEWY